MAAIFFVQKTKAAAIDTNKVEIWYTDVNGSGITNSMDVVLSETEYLEAERKLR
jgi:hypothetical protein